jgi:hypothetical protein
VNNDKKIADLTREFIEVWRKSIELKKIRKENVLNCINENGRQSPCYENSIDDITNCEYCKEAEKVHKEIQKLGYKKNWLLRTLENEIRSENKVQVIDLKIFNKKHLNK